MGSKYFENNFMLSVLELNIFNIGWLIFLQIGAVLVLATILQSIAGFGFNLFLLPIWLSMGISLPQAITMGIICSATQRVYSIRKLHNHIDWNTLRPMMITGLLALPIGIYILNLLTAVKPDIIRQIVGAFILLALAVQAIHIKQKDSIPWIWGHLAAFFSGLLNGIANIGGPPIILWILAHNWSTAKMRVTTMAYTLIFVPFQMILLIWIFRLDVFRACGVAAAYIPIILAATFFGLWIGHKIDRKYMRIIMSILLFAIAVFSIIKL